MAIFPVIHVESKVQVNDKTRINCTKSYVDKSEAAISLVEISPDNGSTWVTVTGSDSDDWYFDTAFSSAGTSTVQCRITTDGSPTSASASITVVSEATDNLFSNDSDLSALEPDILNHIRDGRASYKDLHRQAQTQIMEWLDEKGWVDFYDAKFTVADVINTDELRRLSTYTTLQLIFEGLRNTDNDHFAEKAKKYEREAIVARNRSVLRIDLDGSGTQETYEFLEPSVIRIIRA